MCSALLLCVVELESSGFLVLGGVNNGVLSVGVGVALLAFIFVTVSQFFWWYLLCWDICNAILQDGCCFFASFCRCADLFGESCVKKRLYILSYALNEWTYVLPIDTISKFNFDMLDLHQYRINIASRFQNWSKLSQTSYKSICKRISRFRLQLQRCGSWNDCAKITFWFASVSRGQK